MAIKQEVNSALIVTLGVISGLLLVVILIGLQAWFRYEENTEIQAKWARSRNVQLDRILDEQRARITRTGPTTIPVERAMRLVAQNAGKAPATQQQRQQQTTRPASGQNPGQPGAAGQGQPASPQPPSGPPKQ